MGLQTVIFCIDVQGKGSSGPAYQCPGPAITKYHKLNRPHLEFWVQFMNHISRCPFKKSFVSV